MGVKFDEFIKHYYTGVDVTKAYQESDSKPAAALQAADQLSRSLQHLREIA
jgi:hypothetical protein